MRDRNYRGDYKKYLEHRQESRMFFGIAIVIVGILLMLHTMGVLPYFTLQGSWPVILIIIGALIGVKNGFRRNAWWILILLGIVNLTPQFTLMGIPSKEYVLPGAIIIGGLLIAFRSRKEKCQPGYKMDSTINTNSTVNIDVTFGGKKEIVTTKDFKGGTANVTFAGCEVNLVQADFAEPSVVMVFQVSFGGVELIIPSHWDVQNEINPSFGSVEDERTIQTATTNETKKILILRGNCSFGSIEIKSY